MQLKPLLAGAAMGFALALVPALTPALAADFRVTGGTRGGAAFGTCTTYAISDSAPVAGIGGCSGSGTANSAGASRAGFAELGAKAEAAHFDPFFTVPSIWGSDAQFSDPITFTSTNPIATHVLVSMDLGLDGEIFFGTFSPGGQTSVNMTAEVFLGSSSNRSRITLGPNFSVPIDIENFTLVDGGLNPFGTTDAVLRTASWSVPVGQPLFFRMQMESRVGVTAASGLVNFGQTFRAANANRVFNLAPGVTANAGQWLVNNRLNDPGSVGAIPEPATWAMMIAGFGLVGGMMRRRGVATVSA